MIEKLLKDLTKDQKEFYGITSNKGHKNFKCMNYEDAIKFQKN